MLSSATGAPRSLHLLCAIALLLVVPVRSNAQAPGAEASAVRTSPTGGAEGDATELNLLVGRSTVVNIGQSISRISLSRPEIADAMVTGSQQILVHGKSAGSISMFVWSHSGAIKRFDVNVSRDLSLLAEQLKMLFPGETISVTGNGKAVVIAGTVASKYVIEKAAEVAAGYVEKKEDVVNLLKQQEGVATNQVLLRVRFAEVSRSALTELGTSFFTSPLGYKNYVARTTTEQFPAPIFDDKGDSGSKLVFSDFLNLFLFNNKEGLGTLIRALQTRGLFQSLAEPNLVTEDGKEASFLAGGEYPYPVAQGGAGNLAITIVFKEFGIRLSFTPTLKGGDLVHLKVRPEVSSLDFTNAISFQGFRIPALSTRRADTEIELSDGQTFAIAGLLNNTMTSTMQKIPGIGDIPVLGLLFRSKAAQKQQSELVVMITPQILRRGSMGAATGLPNQYEPYLGPPSKTVPPPPVRLPGPVPKQDDNVPAPVAAPAAAPAAVVSSPAAAAPPVVSAPARVPASSPSRSPAAPSQPPPVPVGTAATPPAVQTPAAAASSAPAPAPRVDQKQLERDRKAAAKAAEKADKDLKAKQEAEGRELARQQELDAKRRQADAKAAEAKKKADAKAAEERRKADVKRADEQVKAERARLAAAQKQAEESRKAEEKAAKERSKREADVAKQSAELQKKQVEAEKKRLKEIQDAVDRLNAAQAAYQAAVGKKDGGQQDHQ